MKNAFTYLIFPRNYPFPVSSNTRRYTHQQRKNNVVNFIPLCAHNISKVCHTRSLPGNFPSPYVWLQCHLYKIALMVQSILGPWVKYITSVQRTRMKLAPSITCLHTSMDIRHINEITCISIRLQADEMCIMRVVAVVCQTFSKRRNVQLGISKIWEKTTGCSQCLCEEDLGLQCNSTIISQKGCLQNEPPT